MALANEIASISLDVPFWILVANLGKHRQYLVKHQEIGSGTLYPMRILSRKMTVAGVLGIATSSEGIAPPSNGIKS